MAEDSQAISLKVLIFDVTMISAIFLINQKGEVVIFRTYRGDVPRSAIDTFRTEVIAKKNTGSRPPILNFEDISYLYTPYANLYLVAATGNNVNVPMTFQFLYELVNIFKAYFGEKWDESTVRNNFSLIYELLDEGIASLYILSNCVFISISFSIIYSFQYQPFCKQRRCSIYYLRIPTKIFL